MPQKTAWFHPSRCKFLSFLSLRGSWQFWPILTRFREPPYSPHNGLFSPGLSSPV